MVRGKAGAVLAVHARVIATSEKPKSSPIFDTDVAATRADASKRLTERRYPPWSQVREAHQSGANFPVGYSSKPRADARIGAMLRARLSFTLGVIYAFEA